MKEGLLPEDVGEFQAVAGDDGASLAPPVDEAETREVTRSIAGERYRFSAEGFFQINHALLADLIAAATDGAEGGAAVDLYCGAGLFTLPLARRFLRVIAVEASAHAVSHARRNLADAGLTNVKVECGTVSSWLEANAETTAPVDQVLLDPPRAGAEGGAVACILSLRPRRITYVSGHPRARPQRVLRRRLRP
jgi:23S rRNA (uracil1939-C5)-methyltransferase